MQTKTRTIAVSVLRRHQSAKCAAVPTLLMLILSNVCFAQDKAWTPLFDGKSLDGWSSPSAFRGAVEDDVKVENGEIRILSTKNLWLVHESRFDDFELVAEAFMPDTVYNSGIGFRCQKGEKVTGYQCEIDRGKSGMIYAIGLGAWVWPKEVAMRTAFEKDAKNNFDNAKWNSFRIRCDGDRIQVWINDKPIADVRDDRFAEGSVALQHHGKGGVHRFRNVKIRQLQSR